MRGNGLEAASYAAIADLDPRVADVMLEVFRQAELAAYVEPCQPQAGALLEVLLPAAPTDRLFVDESELDRAKRLLDEHLLELRDGDDHESAVPDADDEAWQQIVRAYETETETPVPPWPVTEDTEATESSEDSKRDESSEDEPDPPAATKTKPTPTDPEGYVPPAPPPLPRLDPIAKGAWAAVLGGPVLLILAVTTSSLPSWFIPLSVLAFVGGFLVLVLRMRGGPPDESDDGAIV